VRLVAPDMLAWSHMRPWPLQLLVLLAWALALDCASGGILAAVPGLRSRAGGGEALAGLPLRLMAWRPVGLDFDAGEPMAATLQYRPVLLS
jgi:hypothetical protein